MGKVKRSRMSDLLQVGLVNPRVAQNHERGLQSCGHIGGSARYKGKSSPFIWIV